jgi:thioesterase domain-containing protein
MAACYVREMRSAQPEGPYFLGGLSFGGAVALEMAMQLRGEGQEIGLLVLFDTFPGTLQSRLSLIGKLFNLPLSRKVTYLSQKATAFRRHIERWWLPPTLRKVRAAHRIAESRYVMQPYDGPVMLLAPLDTSLRASEDPGADWNEYATHVEVYQVPGDHETLLDEPHVRVVARFLANALKRSLMGRALK